ncbi:Inositol-pentakisphosphate 2-kinase [Rhypophila decipiens]
MSTPSTIPDLAALLADDFDFKFVGEGAANIIFEIIQSQEPDPLLHDKLLRVPKARAIALDYLHVQEYWESSVRPLFQDGDLVNQVLVHLGACSVKQNLIISRLQAAVSNVEPTRRKDFRGSTVGETEYAMLVDDMRVAKSNKGGGQILLEFKPKWLTQSPDAPANAIRCRNCAKEWLRYHDKLQKKLQKPPKLQQSFTPDELQRRQTQKVLPLPVLCTIDLLNSSSCVKARERVLSRLTDPSPTSRSTVALTNAIPEGSRQWRLLSRWLEGNSLLKRLELAQRANNDPEQHLDRNGEGGKRKGGGCLAALMGQENPELDLAMTLRDCTCFVRIPGPSPPPPLENPTTTGAGAGPAEEDDEQGEAAATEQDVDAKEEAVEVEAKLGDLDKKNGAAKLATWQALERRLIDEGFYTRRRPRAEWTCALERTDEDEDED